MPARRKPLVVCLAGHQKTSRRAWVLLLLRMARAMIEPSALPALQGAAAISAGDRRHMAAWFFSPHTFFRAHPVDGEG